MHDTYTYDMYNNDIKYKVEFSYDRVQQFPLVFDKKNVGTPFGTLARQVENSACRLARWHVY